MDVPCRWASVKTASQYLSLHVQTVYSLFYKGKLPGARIGRTVRIDLKTLDAALEKQKEAK